MVWYYLSTIIFEFDDNCLIIILCYILGYTSLQLFKNARIALSIYTA